jgi:hypothetical protein
LPKSPWGNHDPYNEGNNFTETHFLTNNESNNNKTRDFNRKLRLFKRIVKKNNNEEIKFKKTNEEKTCIFKTRSGNMYCKKHPEAEELYNQVNERFKRIREFTFENSDKVSTAISKLQEKHSKPATANDLVKRLYTPSPKFSKQSFMSEKYKILFE